MAPPSETPTAITAGPSSQNKPSLKSKASSSTTSLSLQPLSLADSPRLSHPISCDGCPPPKLETLRDLLLILYHDGNVHIITIAISRLDGQSAVGPCSWLAPRPILPSLRLCSSLPF